MKFQCLVLKMLVLIVKVQLAAINADKDANDYTVIQEAEAYIKKCA